MKLLIVHCVLVGLLASGNAQLSDYQQTTIDALKRELAELKDQYNTQLTELQRRIEVLEQQLQQAATPQQAATSRSQYFNPNFSVMGDFVAQPNIGRRKDSSNDGFYFRELELALTQDIDPYASAAAFISFERDPIPDAEMEVGLEEAYATLPSLGSGWSAQVGKMKAAFGRVNSLHTHAWPWVEPPLAATGFLGEEGFAESGISFSRFLSTKRFVDLTLQAMQAGPKPLAEDMHSSQEGQTIPRRGMTGLARITSFHEHSQDRSTQVGFSYLNAPAVTDDPTRRAHLFGVDVTHKWRPETSSGRVRGLDFESELFWSKRDQADKDVANGYFSSLTYRSGLRSYYGARYDYLESPQAPGDKSRAFSLSYTFRPTEFQFWRLEARRTSQSFSDISTVLWLQYSWSVGPHGAHKF